MSTIDRQTEIALPPLMDGQRLDRATFHERYEAMPDGTKAELIGGMVYMAAAVGEDHAMFDGAAQFWLAYYAGRTPGVDHFCNGTFFFGNYGQPQPDAAIRIRPDRGGQTRKQGRFAAGPPELVVEVSDTSRATDLGPKLADYERAGVLEYVVMTLDPYRIIWHGRREGKLVEIPPGPDGIHQSEAFPGLRLDPAALLARDVLALKDGVDRGVATQAHADFVARLAAGGAGEG